MRSRRSWNARPWQRLKLASRARRRVQGNLPDADRDLQRQRRVVDALIAAAREGNFERLMTVLVDGKGLLTGPTNRAG